MEKGEHYSKEAMQLKKSRDQKSMFVISLFYSLD